MSAWRDSRDVDGQAAMVVPLPVALADVVDDALARVLAGRPGPCLWCGAVGLTVRRAEAASGAVVAVCGSCGSEVSGVAAPGLREAAG